MFAPAASTTEIDFDCTLAELFGLFTRMASGTSPPSNVVTDINPYKYAPSNLPGKFIILFLFIESPEKLDDDLNFHCFFLNFHQFLNSPLVFIFLKQN